MSRDSSFTYLHLPSQRIADLFEEFTRSHLTPEDIYVPPQHQPINPEDEDDVVPDQHAAFGIQRATMKQREPQWRDLGLEDLVQGTGKKDTKNTTITGEGAGKGPGEGVSVLVLRKKGKKGWGKGVGMGRGEGLPR